MAPMAASSGRRNSSRAGESAASRATPVAIGSARQPVDPRRRGRGSRPVQVRQHDRAGLAAHCQVERRRRSLASCAQNTVLVRPGAVAHVAPLALQARADRPGECTAGLAVRQGPGSDHRQDRHAVRPPPPWRLPPAGRSSRRGLLAAPPPGRSGRRPGPGTRAPGSTWSCARRPSLARSTCRFCSFTSATSCCVVAVSRPEV